MTDWLTLLQKEYDLAVSKGEINGTNGYITSDIENEASLEAQMAYKLICNAGDVVDCSRVSWTTQ